MTRRVFLTTVGQERRITNAEPLTLMNATVTVRGGDPTTLAPFDGVWINGERSYDTWVLIDGVATYHSPVESTGVGSFDAHEAAGGGHAP